MAAALLFHNLHCTARMCWHFASSVHATAHSFQIAPPAARYLDGAPRPPPAPPPRGAAARASGALRRWEHDEREDKSNSVVVIATTSHHHTKEA